MPKPIVIFTMGTHGDLRPCVALGQGLHCQGYPVRIVTSKNFADIVRKAGLEFYPLTADFQAMLESDRHIADHGLDLRVMVRLFRDRYAAWAVNWVKEGLAAAEGAGLLIGVSNSILLAQALSQALGIAFAIARLQPCTLSKMLPPIMLIKSQRQLPRIVNFGAHCLMFKLFWHVMCPAINDIVRPQLGLPPYPWYGPYFRELHHAKVINGFSQHVLPRPADWTPNSQVTGYWFLDQPEWRPGEALNDFLGMGPKPVYIGFGSMVHSQAKTFTHLILESVKKSGQRAVLATGWGALEDENCVSNEQIFFLHHAPHDQLFPLLSAAVHHGGAGTTAAAVRAGIPSVIIPFFGDQPFWASRLNSIGVAPPALERRRLTSDVLASMLRTVHQPAILHQAAALGRLVRSEDGIGEAMRWLKTWHLLPDERTIEAASWVT